MINHKQRPRLQHRRLEPPLGPQGRPRIDARARLVDLNAVVPASATPRIDPRAARQTATVPGRHSRPRRVLGAPVGATTPLPISPSATAAAAPAPRSKPVLPTVIVEQPAFLVFAVLDLIEGRPSARDRDLLGGARQLADRDAAGGEGQGAVVAVLFGGLKPDAELGLSGADRVLHYEAAEYAGFAPEARLAALAAAVERIAPRYVVFNDETLDGGGAELGRRLAARLDEPVAANVWKLDGERLVRRARGGSQDLILPSARIILLAPEATDPVSGRRFEAKPLPLPEPAGAGLSAQVDDYGVLPLDPQAVALSEAEFIVAGGNGIRDWDSFRRLAETLGATVGGSRVAVDNGDLPRDRQVGATGTYVSARVYLAIGISGAPQHLQGIADCETVIAINADPNCDMVKRADLAVIGDAQTIIPALIALASQRPVP